MDPAGPIDAPPRMVRGPTGTRRVAGRGATSLARVAREQPERPRGVPPPHRSHPQVLAEVARLPEGRRAIVVDHAIRSADGMAEVLGRAGPDGWIRLSSLPELRAYCYTVAGIVGELLTSLFLHDAPVLAPDRRRSARKRASVRRGAPAGEHPERRARRCQGGAPLPPPRCPAIGGGEARAQGPRLRGGVHRIAGPRRRPHRLRRVHGNARRSWPERP